MSDMVVESCRKSGFTLGMAMIGRFAILYSRTYGRDPNGMELSSFAFHAANKYDGITSSAGTPEYEKMISDCMEMARSEFISMKGDLGKGGTA